MGRTLAYARIRSSREMTMEKKTFHPDRRRVST